MKTKKINKKLTLNKQTISSLNKDEMVSARGGEFTLGETRFCSCECTDPRNTCVTLATVCSCYICP